MNNRHIISEKERGHRNPLAPDEKTVRRTIQFPESLWKTILEKTVDKPGKHQKWIRDTLTKELKNNC